jgi:hypothetical protein
MRFRVLDPDTPSGLAAWSQMWREMPGREVTAHPAYVQLFARPCDRVVALAGEDAGGRILFPLLLRPLGAEPWARRGEARWDATTPYGYGGPFAWGAGPRDDDAFWRTHAVWCREERIVCTFARLSLFDGQLAAIPGRVEERGLNVVRTLWPDPDAVWRDYARNARANVKAAERAGLEVEVDTRAERLDEFIAVYTHTMQRRGANEWYSFPRSFYERLAARLPGQYAFFHAVRGREVVSSELVLVSAEHMYVFLSGTLAEAYPLRPNDLVRHRTAQWGIAHGKKAYVLGGGYEPGDGVFRHKLILAPRGTVPFKVAMLTHDERGYDELLRLRGAIAGTRAPRAGFFPAYRA